MGLLSIQVRAVAVTASVSDGGAAVCPLEAETTGPGLAEQPPDVVWRAVLAATRSVLDHSPAPDAVEVSGEATVVLWDRETLGAARPAVLASDARAESAGPAAILAWLAAREAHTWAGVVGGRTCVGTVEAYTVARMTRGTWFATNRAHAERTGLLDPGTGTWDAALLERLGVTPDALPELLADGQRVGVSDPSCFLDLTLPLSLRP